MIEFIRRVVHHFGLIFIVLLSVSCVGCMNRQRLTHSNEDAEIFITPITLPTDLMSPDFIVSVSPADVITLNEYNHSLKINIPMARGIRVVVRADKVGLSEEKARSDIVKDLVKLIIDGQELSNSNLQIADGLENITGPLYFSWIPRLEPGLHSAIFIIETATDDVLEYEWEFTLVESCHDDAKLTPFKQDPSGFNIL